MNWYLPMQFLFIKAKDQNIRRQSFLFLCNILRLLQRNLIYTAITRAKKLCIFIGQPRAIAMAIKNNKGTVRNTFLQQFLTTDLQCR